MIRRILTCAALAVACATANANFIQVSGYTAPNAQSTASIISSIQGLNLFPTGPAYAGLGNLIRLDGKDVTGTATTQNGITYSSPANGQLSATWDLTGTGDQLQFIYVFGGTRANLYQVIETDQLTSGFGTFFTPINNGGQRAGISHVLFLGVNGEPPSGGPVTVPDGGITVALLGAALTGLGLLRRKLSV